MKTRYALLSTVMTIALTLPMFGQGTHDDTTKPVMKELDMSSMMGKPMVDTTFAGLHVKVWLMTQGEHKEMMKGMKHDGMGMNKAKMDSMVVGTHHIMLDATVAPGGKEIANASAKVLIVSPSKKNSSVDLKPMMSHFGGPLTLSEKGEYLFTVNVNVAGVSKTTQFHYTVN